MDMVVRLQRDVEAMKAGPQLGNLTLGGPASPVQSKPVIHQGARFAGVTSWEQYRQVFDATAQTDGTTLQLLSHLEGDVLNVALPVPEARRATRT